MLKKIDSEPTVSYDWGYVLNNKTPDKITGSIFEIIESLGLPEKQETAIKKVLRNRFWEIFSDDAVQIGSELHTKVRTSHYEKINSNANCSSIGHLVEEI
jgi:hypothetical protein